MLYSITIDGLSGIIHHSAAGIDPSAAINIEKAEITRKRGSNRTEADDARLRELETVGSLWLDSQGSPTIPASAIRAVIETGAKKLKQGPQVREGLVVTDTAFDFDRAKYGDSMEDWQRTTQFTTSVVVQRNRISRTRALFETPWSCTFEVDVDDELVDEEQLRRWLDIGGRRIGLGDWRPEKSGTYGRFIVRSVETLEQTAA